MRRVVISAVLAALAAPGAACLGGASHHATLSADDALAQARKDGFVRVHRDANPLAWRCDRQSFETGDASQGLTPPAYVIGFDDRRVPPAPQNVGRIGMTIIVFRDGAMAKRCAEAAIYHQTHLPTDPSQPPSSRVYQRYKLIDPTTVETSMHAAGAPGFEFADDTGEYDTVFAQGRVLALGIAYNEPHSKIVRDDLERLAADIAG